jgi:hypothetical protein
MCYDYERRICRKHNQYYYPEIGTGCDICEEEENEKYAAELELEDAVKRYEILHPVPQGLSRSQLLDWLLAEAKKARSK